MVKYKVPKVSKSKLTATPSPVQATNRLNDSADESLFFINIDRLKHAKKITHISHEKLKVQLLCVSAVNGETLLEALEKDGRFQTPEAWILWRKDISNSSVDVRQKAIMSKNLIFDVECSKKRTSGSACSPNSDAVHIKVELEEEIDQVPSSPISAAEQTTAINSFSKIAVEFAKSFENNLLAKNNCTELVSLIEKKFSKAIDLSKSIGYMEDLISSSKSVGIIYVQVNAKCYFGTCFLVTENVILTNYHVYDDLKKHVTQSHKVKVSFNFLLPIPKGLVEFEVNMKDIRAECSDKSLDYIFLGLKGEPTGLMGLGEKISVINPDNLTNELVSIIGHPFRPGGNIKRIDTDCRIISKYLWRPELIKSLQGKRRLEFEPLFYCKKAIMSPEYEQKIPYHSSFFHGASGSPVFDDHGKIIAMHVSGWVENEVGREYSYMEFAVTMEGIYNHCYHNYRDMVQTLFPHMFDDMEVDEEDQ